MPTRLKTDASVLHKRLALILATEIRLLRNKQLDNRKEGLSADDVRKLKQLADTLDDQIRTRRLLEGDVTKALEKLPEDQLERLAAGTTDEPPKPRKAAPRTPAKTRSKPRRAKKGARS